MSILNIGAFNLQDALSSFVVLFAVIDAIGSSPIIISCLLYTSPSPRD